MLNKSRTAAAVAASLTIGVAVWISMLTAGMSALWGFSSKPGDPAVAPSNWPAGSKLHLDPQRPTLLVLLHPKCPCSHATVGELARLIAQCEGLVAVHVLMVKPPGVAQDGWESTGLLASADAVPGVAIHVDPGGAQAELFGSFTSGQTMLYHPSGKLLFRGGITRSRGEEGDNAGRDALVALIHDHAARVETDLTPVYGCPLFTRPDFNAR